MNAPVLPTWTPAQRDAMQSRGGSILVSAAAGSGKTAVLVERVLLHITDESQPCNIDELLIVTFTRAAAAGLRERIGAAIAARLAAEPDNAHLREQQLRLPFAQICTIDSFCGDLVRSNFHQLGLAPDYTLLDENEHTLLRAGVCAQVLAALYEEADPAFLALTRLLSDDRGDRLLQETILTLHTQSQAYAFPQEWLQGLLLPYTQKTPLAKSLWGSLILDNIRKQLQMLCSLTRAQLAQMRHNSQLDEAFGAVFEQDADYYSHLLNQMQGISWDGALDLFSSLHFATKARTPKAQQDAAYQAAYKQREGFKKRLRDIRDKLLIVNEAQHQEDTRALYALANALVEATCRFSEKLLATKLEENTLDFADVMQFALSLLVERDAAGTVTRTEHAKALSQQYRELLVDEYQDINKTQDLLFWALSREEGNLFFVGDVKQSIYRFRQAMPELFLEKREQLEPYTSGNYPARITLGHNFRSRRGITQAVNFFFSQLMQQGSAEIDYNDDEALHYGAQYPESGIPDVAMHMLQTPGNSGTEETRHFRQARYAASLIQSMLQTTTVSNKDGTRPLELRDICILLRSASGKASVYAQVLQEAGIPAYSDLSGGFFEAKEIRIVLNLLRVIDNPVQDVPLLGLLLSPLFGFSPDEVASIRLPQRECNLYQCVLFAEKNGNQKCRDFLAQLTALRRLSATCAPAELLRRIYDETGLLAIVGAMPAGRERQANLALLQGYANKYQQGSQTGLPGFLRFLDRLLENNGDLARATLHTLQANVVRIMTIHKSKGLEFPVCVVADGCGKFNDTDTTKPVVVSPRAGLGLRLYDEKTLCTYNTLGRIAISQEIRLMQRAEDQRVLYVALTRAKEKLILLTEQKNPAAYLATLAGSIDPTQAQLDACMVQGGRCFDDWLYMAALRHPHAAQLREYANIGEEIVLPADFAMQFVLAPPIPETEQQQEVRVEAVPDEALVKTIREKIDYEYPYRALDTIVAKQAASAFSPSAFDPSFFASAIPSFAAAKGLSPAKRGTATHLFLQHADFARAKKDPAAELERLVATGILQKTDADAVSLAGVRKFLESDLAARLLASPLVLRERKFAVQIPAGELYKIDDPALKGETVVVQGIADCVFEEDGALVLVDYKTDRVQEEAALIERYRSQVMLYKTALESCLGKPVKETYLYSLTLHRAVAVALP